jgi:hypothetical protein
MSPVECEPCVTESFDELVELGKSDTDFRADCLNDHAIERLVISIPLKDLATCVSAIKYVEDESGAKSARGRITPMLPQMGSTITAATFLRCRAKSLCTDMMSLYLADNVSRANPRREACRDRILQSAWIFKDWTYPPFSQHMPLAEASRNQPKSDPEISDRHSPESPTEKCRKNKTGTS